MKKLLLSIALVAFAFTTTAQDGKFNVGGDISYNFDGEVFGLMGEVNYLFEISDEFRVGPAATYLYSFGKDSEIGGTTISIEGSGNFALAGAARYDVSDKFTIGADLGYFLDPSGFYYRPLVGYNLNENTMIQLSLPSSEASNNLALGVMFAL